MAYADVFDQALRPAEVHRYLERAATADQTAAAIERLSARRLVQSGGLVCLAGRSHLLGLRAEREAVSLASWRRLERVLPVLSRLPWVRLAAVTGTLAMDNCGPEADVDLMVVSAAGRLWLCRLLIVQWVRWARRHGVELCPNYLLAEPALAMGDQSLYTARELAQMVPLVGFATYHRLREANPWAAALLPNASAAPARARRPADRERAPGNPASEALLHGALGDALERWVRARKIREITRTFEDGSREELELGDHVCKGHGHGHRVRTLEAFGDRLRALGLEAAA